MPTHGHLPLPSDRLARAFCSLGGAGNDRGNGSRQDVAVAHLRAYVSRRFHASRREPGALGEARDRGWGNNKVRPRPPKRSPPLALARGDAIK